ncbi:MAG: class I SAM-dependent methyltransferase [Pseudomonadota bacterium]
MKKDLTSIDFHDNAEIYDAINDFDFDLEFYKKWIAKSGNKILEVCCGTGRLGLHLAKLNINYTGLDISNSFLKSFKSKLVKENKSAREQGDKQFEIQNSKFKIKDSKVRLLKRDMRCFDLKQKFDLVFIPFNSFLHLYTYQDASKFMESVKKHLAKKSYCIIDVFNPEPKFLANASKKERKFKNQKTGGYIFKTDSGLKFRLYEKGVYNKKNQILENNWRYLFLDQAREVNKSLNLRMYYPQELNALLAFNGFRIIHKFGDHNETGFNSDSMYQICVCQK